MEISSPLDHGPVWGTQTSGSVPDSLISGFHCRIRIQDLDSILELLPDRAQRPGCGIQRHNQGQLRNFQRRNFRILGAPAAAWVGKTNGLPSYWTCLCLSRVVPQIHGEASHLERGGRVGSPAFLPYGLVPADKTPQQAIASGGSSTLHALV